MNVYMLIVSQTIFYIVSSVAILVVGVSLVIVMYYLICILRDTRNISSDINETYKKVKRNIKKIISLFSKK
ncbi:hypothetical protein CO033_02895 [Candidatus Nomurabacteria bacterium CG_4_9_14_0_2_um_filter_32_10]|uniref:Uncharacterized protein n=3 Tax=Candidatus Nomuraibacteriota TaxID=1752729 RepID=A0A2H0CG43_9BACT|nr:MAG: hypothetical protein COW91_03270 [Candidatus Nomurabacteria bacterium CG22_combo_CG10-13_8_21_14_all_32_8]PIZ85323.1 MAG: hypothetical protein COX94_02915 [Candidatus Nomurabacteria bacterium CG_4_10_14_0_2_um_filter_33_9]PJC49192.1 MAG: hypothetical protein CO033_02895 [Candidatus Nomurabacteria bacterium CG_4_9_14_0_2_um_filter_32_10]